MTPKKKIAVLGGGLSAITSVYNLILEPDWKSKYEITVYQMGWRIGGKGASGVNQKSGCRIEEHGLHLWMGFYENAFCMMRKIYELNNRPVGTPLATFDDAFKGQPYMVFAENINDQWQDWQINFPTINGTVGDGTCGNFANLVESILDDILRKIKDHFDERTKAGSETKHHHIYDHLIPGFLKDDVEKIRNGIEKIFATAAAEFFHLICQLLIKLEKIEQKYMKHLHGLIDSFKHWLWDEIGEDVSNNTSARHLWISIDMMTALFHGLINDDMLVNDNGTICIDFNKVNDCDYAHWFTRNGADKDLTVASPLITSMYDGPFAFIKGDVSKPNIEAGTTLRNFLRLSFTCKEQVVFRMQAGMGDTIFGPAYEVMNKMGVKFEFFNKLVNLKLSDDKSWIDEIQISKQVRLKGDTYNPLFTVNGLNCWPSEPLYDQLNEVDAKALQLGNINLESSWSPWKDTGGNLNLKFGKDFDTIILGASLGSMPDVASELISANADWKNMVEKVLTVQTQAYQFWLNQSPSDLKVEEQKLLSCYVEPLDTFSEMNQLLVRENWPASADAKYIAYMCGAFPEAEIIPPYSDHNFPASQQARAAQKLSEYFKNNLQHILPNAFVNGEFNWNYLVDLENGTGEQRLFKQYIRANIDPSERYVMSVVDSTRYRIATDKTGFANLFITGDWTYNHFNSGFVECAVTAGILTARAISGNNSLPIYLPSWDKIDF